MSLKYYVRQSNVALLKWKFHFLYCPEIEVEPFTSPDIPENWNPIKIEPVNITFAPQLPQTKEPEETKETKPRYKKKWKKNKNAMVSNNMIKRHNNYKPTLAYGKNVTAVYAKPNYQPPHQFEDYYDKDHTEL